MGACFDLRFVEETDKQKAKEIFESMQEECRYENGHSYSGGIGMATGLRFTDEVFSGSREAEEWLEDNAEKWGPALAVRFNGIVNRKEYDGWLVGAICSS